MQQKRSTDCCSPRIAVVVGVLGESLPYSQSPVVCANISCWGPETGALVAVSVLSQFWFIRYVDVLSYKLLPQISIVVESLLDSFIIAHDDVIGDGAIKQLGVTTLLGAPNVYLDNHFARASINEGGNARDSSQGLYI